MQSSEPQDLVVVGLAGKRYALSSEIVREVLQLMEPTPMPNWPDTALGVIEVRGEFIPLLDIITSLGITPGPLSKDQFILVLLTLERTWAIVVDKVEGVKAIPVKAHTKLAPLDVLDNSAICIGLAVDVAGPIVVLDPAAIVKGLPGLRLTSGDHERLVASEPDAARADSSTDPVRR